MAWQLIYTSAPRLLEAGRSGFGTVARHRQISPLLVSTIERASQFARLPGLDTGRVIYCHRIVAVAGGRFHVLSCIRDAGADYTGRTNHLAHHLIAEQREVAALGRRGASPADVLLGMSWVSAWDEAPRFLEATDEIALANFGAQGAGHWEQATGDGQNAWLLAAGEASRGAYILYEPGTDARRLFAESLRLAPDRLWQVPFTTALQPSDEPSDFRWIALEADSSLRGQAESSSRPVLDLTRPATLPAPEVPANAAIAGLPRPTALGSVSRETIPKQTSLQIRATSAKFTPTLSAPKRGSRRWLVAGSAAALFAAIGFGVIRPRIAAEENLRNRREDLKKRVVATHIFSAQTAEWFSGLKAETLSPADQIVGEVEKANDALKTIRFDKMRDCTSGDDLQKMGAALGIEVPVEMQTFADRVRRLDSLNTEIAKPAASERVAYDALQRQRDAIEAFAKETGTTNAFSGAVDELRRNRERADAAALLALMHPRDSHMQNLPPVETALVKERLSRGKPADAVAAKAFAATEKLINAWESVQATRPDRVAENLAVALRDSRGVWPEWLIKQADEALAKSRGETPPPVALPAAKIAPTVPLYFFTSADAFHAAIFSELEKDLTYFIRPSLQAPPMLLHQSKSSDLTAWRRQIGDEKSLFSRKDGENKLSLNESAATLPRPFVLLARNAVGQDAMQIWMVEESDKLILGKRTTGLGRTGNTLSLDVAELGIPGVPTSSVTLRLASNCAISGRKSEPLTVKDWRVDLAPMCAEIERLRAERERQIKKLESALAPASGVDGSARLAEMKRTIREVVAKEIADWAAAESEKVDHRENDVKKRAEPKKAIEAARKRRIEQMDRDFGKESDALFQQVGGCIKALSHEATFQDHDAVFNAGGELSIQKPGGDQKALSAACDSALTKVQAATRNLGSKEAKNRYASPLGTLEAMIVLVAPETTKSKEARANHARQSKSDLVKYQGELRVLAAHPLLTKDVPPGAHRLSVFAEGVEIPLLEIEIIP